MFVRGPSQWPALKRQCAGSGGVLPVPPMPCPPSFQCPLTLPRASVLYADLVSATSVVLKDTTELSPGRRKSCLSSAGRTAAGCGQLDSYGTGGQARPEGMSEGRAFQSRWEVHAFSAAAGLRLPRVTLASLRGSFHPTRFDGAPGGSHLGWEGLVLQVEMERELCSFNLMVTVFDEVFDY